MQEHLADKSGPQIFFKGGELDRFTILKDEGPHRRMRLWTKREVSRQRYRLRKQMVEPQISEIKQVRDARRFLHHVLRAVRSEWTLVCVAVNVGILPRHWKEALAVRYFGSLLRSPLGFVRRPTGKSVPQTITFTARASTPHRLSQSNHCFLSLSFMGTYCSLR